MKPTLLIAGAGYLGTEIALQAEADYSVVTATKTGSQDHQACDLSDRSQVELLASEIPQPTAVIHCASSGRGGAGAYQKVFVEGSENLRSCFPNSHLVLTSSTSVYHQTNGEEVDESSATEPIRETSQLLLTAEQTILKSGGTVARLAGLYGPDRSVLLRKFLDGSAVIEEEGSRILNQIHVTDAASAVLFLTRKQATGIFNVTDNHPTSQLETYRALAEFFDQPLPPVGPRNDSRKRAWTNKIVLNNKLSNLGWKPGFASFTDALPSLTSS